jgi:chromosomal replication initiation ATPase DnaA
MRIANDHMKCTLQFAQRSWVMKVMIEEIQIAVAGLFHLSLEEFTRHSRKRTFAVPRHIAMYLARHFTDGSLSEIGQQFGFKCHTTVLRSIAKIDGQRRTDVALNQILNELANTLNLPQEGLCLAEADKNPQSPPSDGPACRKGTRDRSSARKAEKM